MRGRCGAFFGPVGRKAGIVLGMSEQWAAVWVEQRGARVARSARLGRGLALCALGLAMLSGACWKDRGRVGTLCDAPGCEAPPEPPCTGADCGAPPACEGDACAPVECPPGACVADAGCTGDGCSEPVPVCDAGTCCGSAVCAPDACAAGGCEPPLCDGGSCAAPSCDGGTCIAGQCDGGDCEPDMGCNATFPICAVCAADSDCDDDLEETRCDSARGECVECVTDTHCSGDESYCIDGECEECREDSHCPGTLSCRSGECGFD